MSAEVPKHTPLHDTLKFEPMGLSEPAGRMELDIPVGGSREHAVEHHEMVVEMRVERRSEAMQKRQAPKSGVPGCPGARMAQRSADGPHEDSQHTTGDARIVVQKRPQAFGSIPEDTAATENSSGRIAPPRYTLVDAPENQLIIP